MTGNRSPPPPLRVKSRNPYRLQPALSGLLTNDISWGQSWITFTVDTLKLLHYCLSSSKWRSSDLCTIFEHCIYSLDYNMKIITTRYMYETCTTSESTHAYRAYSRTLWSTESTRRCSLAYGHKIPSERYYIHSYESTT